jgi:hypothetical protein
MAGKNLNNLHFGAGELFYFSGGAWLSFGYSNDGGTLTYDPVYVDFMANETGETILKKVSNGENATFTTKFMQNEKGVLNKAMPLSTIYTSGAQEALGVGITGHSDLLDLAVALKYNPTNSKGTNGADDLTYLEDDLIIWKAASSSSVALAFMSGEFTGMPVTFTIFPDTTRDSGSQVFVVGDPAVVGYAQTDPVVLGTIPAVGAVAVAVTVSSVIVVDQQLVDDRVDDGDVGVIVNATGVEVAAAKTYGKTISQLFNSAITANNPDGVTSPNSFTLAAAEVLALDDILNGLTVKITEGGNTHTTTISDYTLAGVVTLAVACPFTFTAAMEYTIYGGFIQINPTASMGAAALHSVVVGGLTGKNLRTMASPISNSFTTA